MSICGIICPFEVSNIYLLSNHKINRYYVIYNIYLSYSRYSNVHKILSSFRRLIKGTNTQKPHTSTSKTRYIHYNLLPVF